MGLLIPKSWTDLVVSQEIYHAVALGAGTVAGVATLAGIALLIYRRRTTGPVFLATTSNDKLMYVVLVAAIVLGMIATLTGSHTSTATSTTTARRFRSGSVRCWSSSRTSKRWPPAPGSSRCTSWSPSA